MDWKEFERYFERGYSGRLFRARFAGFIEAPQPIGRNPLIFTNHAALAQFCRYLLWRKEVQADGPESWYAKADARGAELVLDQLTVIP